MSVPLPAVIMSNYVFFFIIISSSFAFTVLKSYVLAHKQHEN